MTELYIPLLTHLDKSMLKFSACETPADLDLLLLNEDITGLTWNVSIFGTNFCHMISLTRAFASPIHMKLMQSLYLHKSAVMVL